MDFAVFHGIAQEGQPVLVNQKQTDGNQDIVGMAAARIEIGKRYGKQAEQEDADGQRDAPTSIPPDVAGCYCQSVGMSGWCGGGKRGR